MLFYSVNLILSKIMKKFGLFNVVLVLLLGTGTAFAQNTVTVKGVVTETGTLLEIPAVAVSELGSTTNRTISDDSGHYTITVPKDAVLLFQVMGYQDLEVPVQGKNEINVSMQLDAIMLEGAISVGYGSAKKVGNIVGNVTTVNSETVKNAPSASALDLLQGQVAGMQVLSTGGVAGDNNISMKIHGVGSLTSSSEPLFIVDGIQSSSSAVMAMNPNDILNITVLTDASSTSIYGSQGANGVVFVTTKAGAYNRDATITFTSQYGISTLANRQFYDNMMTGPELKNFWIRSGLYSESQIYKKYTSKGYDADTRWYEYMQRFNNPQYQNDILVEGGGDKVAYLFGASQFHQDGNTYGNFYDRYTLRSNIQARPKDWIKAGVNLNLSLSQNMQNENWGNSSENSNYASGGLSYMLNPLFPAIDPETGEEYEVKYPTGIYTPKYDLFSYWNQFDTYRLLGSAFVELEPIHNFILSARVGTDAYFEHMNRYLMPSSEMSSGSGMIQKTTYYGAKSTINTTAEYTMNLTDKDVLTVLAGMEGINSSGASFYSYGRGLTDDRYMSLDYTDPENREVGQNRNEYRFFSLLGNVTYSHDEKYFLDFTVRNDASSRFGENHRNGTFWAAGLMWKASNEGAIRDLNSFMEDLRFKISYGTQGNANIGNYIHLGIISALSVPYKGSTGVVLASPPNGDITWENQSLLTVGASARFYDFMDVEVSYYSRNTTDMLMEVPQPHTSGFSSIYQNVGAMRNSGVDLSFNFDLLNTRDWTVQARATFTYNREIVTELFDGRKRWDIANTGMSYVVGSPVMYYSPIYAGVNPETGEQQWYLPAAEYVTEIDPTTGQEVEKAIYNKDVCTMDPERVTSQYNEEILTQNTGYKRHEPINGGFGLSARYRNLSLRADFAYVLGKYLWNNDAYFYANPNQFTTDNQHKMVSDFWTPYNTDAKFPDWSQGQVMQKDSHLIEDASFLRLKTLVLAYSLPQRVLMNQKVIKGLTFTLTGRNLLTFTNYSGLDPEVDSNVTLGIPGNTLQVLGGLELRF